MLSRNPANCFRLFRPVVSEEASSIGIPFWRPDKGRGLAKGICGPVRRTSPSPVRASSVASQPNAGPADQIPNGIIATALDHRTFTDPDNLDEVREFMHIFISRADVFARENRTQRVAICYDLPVRSADSGGLNDWKIGNDHHWSGSEFSGSGADE